jgi:hypothetical protein
MFHSLLVFRIGAVVPLLLSSICACEIVIADDDIGIKAEVKREQIGKALTAEGHEQVSMLSAHLLSQVQQARIALDANDSNGALQKIKKTLQLAGIIRSMIPKIHITTLVRDVNGKVIYEDVTDVQDDTYVVYHKLSEIDQSRLAKPEQKGEEKAGLKYQGSEFVDVDVVMDLGYVERRLQEAERLVATEPLEADRALAEAQSSGTSVVTSMFESPLHDAHKAVQFAHESAERHEYKAAQANLNIAREYLALYRDLVPASQHEEVDKLRAEIEKTASEVSGTTENTHAKTTETTQSLLKKIKNWTRNLPSTAKDATIAPKSDSSPTPKATARPSK